MHEIILSPINLKKVADRKDLRVWLLPPLFGKIQSCSCQLRADVELPRSLLKLRDAPVGEPDALTFLLVRSHVELLNICRRVCQHRDCSQRYLQTSAIKTAYISRDVSGCARWKMRSGVAVVLGTSSTDRRFNTGLRKTGIRNYIKAVYDQYARYFPGLPGPREPSSLKNPNLRDVGLEHQNRAGD